MNAAASGALPLRSRCARSGGDRCRGRGRQPSERQPHGQLRPALEPEPPRAALRPHSPHRADRGLPPLEPRRQGNARRRCLSPPAEEAGSRKRRRSKGRVFDILGEVFEETSLKDLLMRGHPLWRPARSPRAPHQEDRPGPRSRPSEVASQPQCAGAGDDERGPALRRQGRDGEGRSPPPAALFRAGVLPEGASMRSAARPIRAKPGASRSPMFPPPSASATGGSPGATAASTSRSSSATSASASSARPFSRSTSRACPRGAHAPRPSADAVHVRHDP